MVKPPRMRRVLVLLVVFLVSACVTVATPSFDQQFGPAYPARFDVPSVPEAAQSYATTIQPILDRRCVVCHACFDGPCQLKTTSWEGVARGASKTPVYDATRLLAAPTTRLYEDAQKPSEWRTRGFFPVLNEHASNPEAERTSGLLYRMLTLKQQHPMNTDGPVRGNLDLSMDRASMCPREEEIDAYERNTPLGGMPFGLPALSDDEHRVLTAWLDRGAPFEGRLSQPAEVQGRVATWERFLNGDSLKTRLFARYAYEHLFLAHLYFDDVPSRPWFKLVRSVTPPGVPVQLIASRRPVDPPGVDRVYYRLVAERETVVAKTHMPYELSARRMARWQALFLDPAYEVGHLPGYDSNTAANPFLTFASLPVGARYQFMLDEAAFTIMGFIKGPVCRGPMALNVIEDQFWVTFLAPSEVYDNAMADLLKQEADLLRLPSGSSNTDIVVAWTRYQQLEARYVKAKTDFYTRSLRGRQRLDLRLLWDGEGTNDNAALTVFRHYDSATVVKGLVGDTPKTAWVIGYPMLERIHYLLVADFDVYGNIGHQLNSRLYMDFLRMEGESQFIGFLPQAARVPVRDAWYRGVGLAAREQVYGGPATTLDVQSDVVYRTADPKTELLDQIRERMKPALGAGMDGPHPMPEALRSSMRQLASVRGLPLQWLPEAAVLVVDRPGATPVSISLLRNTGHASVSNLIGESTELLPAENTLTVTAGVISAYPNAFYRTTATELPAFIQAVRQLDSEAAYGAFARRWAVQRTDAGFWAFSDALHERFGREQPLEAGVLDYNRLENR
jgi:hypothetical protein